jgi:hypothetical protein
MALLPNFKWAQDKQHIFLTIEVADCKDAKVELKETVLTFRFVLAVARCDVSFLERTLLHFFSSRCTGRLTLSPHPFVICFAQRFVVVEQKVIRTRLGVGPGHRRGGFALHGR